MHRRTGFDFVPYGTFLSPAPSVRPRSRPGRPRTARSTRVRKNAPLAPRYAAVFVSVRFVCVFACASFVCEFFICEPCFVLPSLFSLLICISLLSNLLYLSPSIFPYALSAFLSLSLALPPSTPLSLSLSLSLVVPLSTHTHTHTRRSSTPTRVTSTPPIAVRRRPMRCAPITWRT